MLIDQKETLGVLRQIVFKVTIDRALHEDLTQEAFIHLWLREQQCPGQTQSWYFQSCRFFLQNLVRTGRSVDSLRHSKTLCPLAETDDQAHAFFIESAPDGSVVSLISARETVHLLAKWLIPLERQILGCLADGLGVREIAVLLSVSHTRVIRHRRKIAALALALNIEPLPGRNGRQRRSESSSPANFRNALRA